MVARRRTHGAAGARAVTGSCMACAGADAVMQGEQYVCQCLKPLHTAVSLIYTPGCAAQFITQCKLM
jgi:hypothetical protein